MTNQEAFDQVWNYFVIKKHGFTNCVYYDQDSGARCAVGCLMPIKMAKKCEEEYHGFDIAAIIREDTDIKQRFKNVCIKLLEDLQSANDVYIHLLLQKKNAPKGMFEVEPFHKYIKPKLIDIATKYSLHIPK